MLSVANMIVIGTPASHPAAREFALSLIRQHAAMRPVHVVCLSGPYLQDTCVSPAETGLPLDAGASLVQTLRAAPPDMEEGLAALLSRLPRGSCVIGLADDSLGHDGYDILTGLNCPVIMDVGGLGISPASCTFQEGRWRTSLGLSVAVLAGGQSTRMGEDKSLLPIAGRTMIEHIIAQLEPWTDDMLIGANDPDTYSFTGLPVIKDRKQGCGPLMGIASCLEAARNSRIFVVACDIPEIPPSFFHRLVSESRTADVVMPLDAEGRAEPLLAVYSKKALPAMRAMLERGARRVVSILSEQARAEFSLSVKYVELGNASWYRNVNTKEEYHRMKKA